MSLLDWDRTLFFVINNLFSAGWADFFFIPLRNQWLWVPLYVVLAARVIGRDPVWGLRAILVTILVVLVAVQLSSHLIKPWVERPRPCLAMAGHVRLLVPCGPVFSFPSSHATNHFAYAIFTRSLLQPLWPGLRRLLWLWAALIGYAQVYVGVHYPLDVLAGAILGSLTARSAHFVFARYLRYTTP